MITIPAIANFYSKAKEHNIISGIILFDIITFLSYIINPISIIYPGDLDLIFGGVVSLLFALKNRKDNQNVIELSFYVGFFGACLSALSISALEWIVFIVSGGYSIITLLSFLFTFISMAFIFGLVLSSLLGYIYYRKDRNLRQSKSNTKYTDEYLEDLLNK
ncbi:MAG: hypothetical protein ACFE9R_08930 [Candidatus Hermodarchaeota archaeon]